MFVTMEGPGRPMRVGISPTKAVEGSDAFHMRRRLFSYLVDYIRYNPEPGLRLTASRNSGADKRLHLATRSLAASKDRRVAYGQTAARGG